jgi:hypothetical protein
MAQIFISHSKKDKDFRGFFSNAFSGTKVKAIFEEFEKIFKGEITSEQIKNDIEKSKAVFVILSQNVQNIHHTRDWINWETGVGINKDIWVFEPYSQFRKISVVTPCLRHYIIFDTSDSCLGYMRKIIESYDDSHVLPTILVAGGIGGLLGKKEGAALGALAGLVISDKSKDRPAGTGVICSECSSSYNIHIPQGMNMFRCPVCNTYLKIKL